MERSERICPRIRRTSMGTFPMARASTVWKNPAPSTAEMRMHNSILGRLDQMSRKRMIRVSVLPPKYPAIQPIRHPSTALNTAAQIPRAREYLPP